MLYLRIVSGLRRRSPHYAVRSCRKLSRRLVQLFTSQSRLWLVTQAERSCILGRMIRWARFNSSRRTGLALLLLTAVLAPVVILLFVQYRSFSDLERKTRVAAQENLRQLLQNFSRRVGENAEAFTTEILSGIDPVDVEKERLDR